MALSINFSYAGDYRPQPC